MPRLESRTVALAKTKEPRRGLVIKKAYRGVGGRVAQA